MSTILNALRKLEADSNSLRPWSAHIRTANRRSRSRKRLFLSLTMMPMAMLGVAAGFFYYRNPVFVNYFLEFMAVDENPEKTLNRPSDPIAAKKSVGSSLQPTPDSAYKTDLPGAASDKTPPPINAKAPNPRWEPMALSTQKQKPEAATPPADSRLDRKGTDYHADPLSLPSPATIPLNQAKSLSKKPPAKENSAPVAIYNDPSMLLQAIAWSKDPKERIAVINGEILREGESIEGFTIKGIEEDTVVIRQGDRQVRLVFRVQ